MSVLGPGSPHSMHLDVGFGEGAAAEYKGVTIQNGIIMKVVGLDQGTVNGKPSVGIFVGLQDGTMVLAETTWALFNAAHAACRGRFGEPT